MLYMLCCAALAISGTLIMLNTMAYAVEKLRNGARPDPKLIAAVWIMMFMTLAAISPVVYLMYQVFSSLNDNIVAFEDTNHSLAIQITALIASFIVALCYLYIAKNGFKKIGAIGFIACVLLALIYGNSLYFLGGDNVGTANITALRSISKIDDVNCNADFLLVKLSKNASEPSQWRCPTALILIKNSNLPFIPYPDYQSGSSTELSTALHVLMNNAKDLSKE